MRVIHKKLISFESTQIIKLQKTDKILKFGEQGGTLCMWYLTTLPTKPQNFEEVTIDIIGTGVNVDVDISYYFDTIVMKSLLVWHIFVRRGKS